MPPDPSSVNTEDPQRHMLGTEDWERVLPMRPGVGHASGSAGYCSLCEMQSAVSHMAIVSSRGGACYLHVAFVSSRASREPGNYRTGSSVDLGKPHASVSFSVQWG